MEELNKEKISNTEPVLSNNIENKQIIVEQKEVPEKIDKILETQAVKVEEKTEELTGEGKKMEQELIKQNANKEEIGDFNIGEKQIEEKAKTANGNYTDSLKNLTENKTDDYNVSKKSEIGSSQLDTNEIIESTALKKSSDKDDEKILSKYKESIFFKKTIKDLENIIQKEGLKGIRIKPKENTIAIESFDVYKYSMTDDKENNQKIGIVQQDRNRIIIGEENIKNIKDLFELDKELAVSSISNIAKHEKQHYQNPSLKLADRISSETKEMVEVEKNTTKDLSVIEWKSNQIEHKYSFPQEMQTELQRINESYGNSNDYTDSKKNKLELFVESQARLMVGTDVITKGIDYLERNKYEPVKDELPKEHFSFIKPELQEKIIEKMEEIRENLVEKLHKNDKEKDTNNHCSACGAEMYLGAKFCGKCGNKAEVVEKKESNKLKDFKSFHEGSTELTEMYKKDYPETVANLIEKSKEAGFKDLYIKSSIDSIHVNPGLTKEAVFFPALALKNQNLLEQIDKDFTDKGTKLVMLHEKNHLNGPSCKSGDKKIAPTSDEEWKFLIKYFKEKGKTEEEAMEQLHKGIKAKKGLEESQTNLQMIVKNPEDFKNIVDSIAIKSVYGNVVLHGIEQLKKEPTKDFHQRFYKKNYNFLKPEIIDQIIEREKEIKKELLDKMDKINKDSN